MTSKSITEIRQMTSKEIATLVEKRHDNVKRTIETLVEQGVILKPQIEEVSTGQRGPKTEVYVFTADHKRDTYVVVAQLSPELTARIVDRWQELEHEVATRSHLIRTKRDANYILTSNLADLRDSQGKDTDARHYMSEHKLCNWAITGVFAALDETTLSNEDVELLREVREMNAYLIASGQEYKDRKPTLARFVTRRRTKQLAHQAA